MRADVRDQWIASIYGHKDGWIKSPLATPDEGRSIVGILCDMAAEAGVTCRTVVRRHGVQCYAYDGSSLFPPPSVLTWAHINRDEVEEILRLQDEGYSVGHIVHRIRRMAEMNDERESSSDNL